MTVYAMAFVDIKDREHYAKYEAGFMDALAPFGAEILAADEEPNVLEGEAPKGRIVLIRFPSADKLDAWYNSDAYQAILPFRKAASNGHVISVKAFEMP
ncbi:MAG: DUF1330 domain-containing protein [Rhodobiaceae bacterium]|nr:DUF1330 domain-containing protein [Rhodobiaceae bacterium]